MKIKVETFSPEFEARLEWEEWCWTHARQGCPLCHGVGFVYKTGSYTEQVACRCVCAAYQFNPVQTVTC